MISPRTRAIFFDLDDTILDHRGAARAALLAFHGAYQEICGETDLARFSVGFDAVNDALWRQYFAGTVTRDELRRRRISDHLIESLRDRPELLRRIDHDAMGATYMRGFVDATVVHDGVVPLLESLGRRYTLGVISNGFSSMQRQRLRAGGLDHYFEHHIYSDVESIHKPDRRIFEAALAAAGTGAEETVYCGDSFFHDIQGAIGAGLSGVWYNPDDLPVPDDLRHIRPTASVRSIEELGELFGTPIQPTSATAPADRASIAS